MGALFISHVRLVNHISLSAADNSFTNTLLYVTDKTISNVLKGYFSDFMLRRIEAAFEGTVITSSAYYNNDYKPGKSLDDAAGEWKTSLPDATKRLRSICKNIVKHGGDFDIYDVPKALKTRKKAA